MKLKLPLLLMGIILLFMSSPSISYAVNPNVPTKKKLDKSKKKGKKLIKKIEKLKQKLALQRANGKKGGLLLLILFIYLLAVCLFGIIGGIAYFIAQYSRSQEERDNDRHDFTFVVGLSMIISIIGGIISARKLKKLKEQRNKDD